MVMQVWNSKECLACRIAMKITILMIYLSTFCASQAIIDNEQRLICEMTSEIQFNVTLRGGMRNKKIQYLGRRKTTKECRKMVCGIDGADFAFMLSDHCYAVTCLTKCEVTSGDTDEETRLIGISRTTFMSDEHRIMMDVFRKLANEDIRPRMHSNNKINVLLNLRLVQLLDVDAVRQAIKLNVWTTQKWRNPLLAWKSKDYGNISVVNVEPTMLWTPVLILHNNADNNMGSLRTLKTKVIVNSSGYSTWFASTSMKASCKINVKYFPFDQQICHLTFGSWTNAMHEMVITPFAKETGLQHFTQNAEWDVVKFKAEKRLVKHLCCKIPFSEVVYHLHLRRKTLYYMYTLVLPVTTIASLIAVGFCLPPNSGERIILSVTILVSMTVYLNIASKKLPSTSDNIPLLSLFYFLLFIQIAMSLAASTFVLANFYRQKFSKPMPDWFRWLIFDNLGKLLCGQKFSKTRPPHMRAKTRRKTVRFSDIITVNGSTASVNSKGSKRSAKEAVQSNCSRTKQEDNSTKEHNDKENNEINRTLPNGSFHMSASQSSLHCPGTPASNQSENPLHCSYSSDSVHLIENIIGMKAIESVERKQAQLINTEMEVLTQDVYEKDRKKEKILEWQYASMIIDRAFLIIFIFTLTVSLCFFLLHKIPHLTDNDM